MSVSPWRSTMNAPYLAFSGYGADDGGERHGGRRLRGRCAVADAVASGRSRCATAPIMPGRSRPSLFGIVDLDVEHAALRIGGRRDRGDAAGERARRRSPRR